ncbi:MAG: tRNA 2-thiouridine(34) synthase MnmA, partial [Clostridia bacterium]|nr:tRNA 2-thiouridine(34) synthase MnmA [Clostridia bacterium]
HEGVLYYTLGQRRGLNIGGKSDGNGERWFVCDKDVKNNTLIASQGEDDMLYRSSLIATNFNWIPKIPNEKNFNCFAKFRYRQPDQKVSVNIQRGGKVEILFKEKQRAVTPGQYVVLYDEQERCLGGGVIDNIFF